MLQTCGKLVPPILIVNCPPIKSGTIAALKLRSFKTEDALHELPDLQRSLRRDLRSCHSAYLRHILCPHYPSLGSTSSAYLRSLAMSSRCHHCVITSCAPAALKDRDLCRYLFAVPDQSMPFVAPEGDLLVQSFCLLREDC